MKNNKAFTLIELLVVVLIIGILAAIAVPKYQYAVVKARVGTVMSALKSMEQAQNTYFLTNGTYAPDASALDISMPAECSPIIGEEGYTDGGNWKCGDNFLISHTPYTNYYRIYANYCPGHNDSFANCASVRDFQIYVQGGKYTGWGCFIKNESSLGNKFCADFNSIYQ